MELDITWERVVRVWWSYVWRNLIGILVAAVIGGILGGILGYVMARMGISKQFIMFATTPIGIFMGLGISIVPMKLILGKDFGEFRLVLLSKDATP